MPTTVRSFSKINLGLAVGPLRPDGFHALTTVYQTLALHDLVTVAAHPAPTTRITLEADHPAVPSTATGDAARNTAFRMVALALEFLATPAEVHLTIEKRLPVQGGLGAGSANAAAALLGLERELGVALPHPDRLALAAQVGSDVPLFLLGGTVLGLNRGEAVYPLPDSPPLPVVIAIPTVGVSTAQAFRDLDARMASQVSAQATADRPKRVLKGTGFSPSVPLTPFERGFSPGSPPPSDHSTHLAPQDLTQTAPDARLEKLSRVLASVWTHTGVRRVPTGIASSSSSRPAGTEDQPSGSASASSQEQEGDLAGNPGPPTNLVAGVENPLLALVRTGVDNDFEAVAFRQHPSLRDIKRALAGSSETPGSAALCAALSGSGSALFGIYGSPEAAHEAQHRVQSLGARALLTETLGYREYWQQMFA